MTCDGSQPESPGAVGTKAIPRTSEGSGEFPISRTDTHHLLGFPRGASPWYPPEFQVPGAGPWTHMNKVVGV